MKEIGNEGFCNSHLRKCEKLEFNLLKRTVLREKSSVVGMYYSLSIRIGKYCYTRTMEHGSLVGTLSNVESMLREDLKLDVVVDVVCTADDVANLRHRECGQVYPSRHDDVTKIMMEAKAFGQELSSIWKGSASILCVVLDQGLHSCVKHVHVEGEWHCADLVTSFDECIAAAIESDASKKANCIADAVGSSSLEDIHFDVSNCLPNYDTKMSWVEPSDISKLSHVHGSIRVMRMHSMKAMYMLDWKIATVQQCLRSLSDASQCESRDGKRTKTFKKRRSEHGEIGGDFASGIQHCPHGLSSHIPYPISY